MADNVLETDVNGGKIVPKRRAKKKPVPCPFCGTVAMSLVDTVHGEKVVWWTPVCGKCSATSGGGETQKAAVETWEKQSMRRLQSEMARAIRMLHSAAIVMSNSGLADRCKAGNDMLDIIEPFLES
tara:strand:- start:44 stop:421 length:378 start_codon:yes stop_codon:yes gene_type:complete